MKLDFLFFFNSILLGIGLAMDAFSVSLANGLNEPQMSKKKMLSIAGTFGFFQALMPTVGWLCVHTIVEYFTAFEKCIPWIALILLLYIGSKMLREGLTSKGEDAAEAARLTPHALFIQGVATSIDALSVGFTIAEYSFPVTALCALIIASVTFIICMAGLNIGRKFGTKLAGKATIIGGIILILIGIEIFLNGIF